MSLLRRLLKPRRRADTAADRIAGRFDDIGAGHAIGWAADRTDPGRVVAVHLRVDGRTVASALANGPRPDVQAAGFGQGLGGFSLRIPDGFADGAAHAVAVIAEPGGADLPGGPRTYRSDIPAPEGDPASSERVLGQFEGVVDGAAIGWACDRAAPGERVRLELRIDGEPAGTFLADRSRLDVAAAGHGDGFNGFSGRMPARFYDGQPHRIAVVVADTGIALPGGPYLLQQARSGMATLDRAATAVAGWATQGADVAIRFDGGAPIIVPSRRLVPGFGDEATEKAACGFRAPIPPACLDGAWHAASVRFAGSDEELAGSPFEFRLRTPPIRLALTRSGGARVEGWTSDPLAPDRPVRLLVSADGAPLGEVVAQTRRADAPDRPGRGFAFTLPRGARRLDFASAEAPEAVVARFALGGGAEARPIETEADALQDAARFADAAFTDAIRNAFTAFLAEPGARFDAEWYRLAHPDADRAIAPGADRAAAALAHYRERGHAEGLSPSPLFDEAWYRRRWPSVGGAVAAGLIPCGFAHYLAFGARAGFDPVPGFDGAAFLAAHPEAAEAVREGRAADPLESFLKAPPETAAHAEPLADSLAQPQPSAPDPSRSLYAAWIARLLNDADDPALAAALAESDRAAADGIGAAPLSAAPLVSIVMPTFNRAHTIAEAVRSVLDQSYGHWELLVCDDGSTDRTALVMAQMADPRIRYFSFEKTNGATTRNKGLAFARGTYIAYLDSDNLWHPHYLDAMLRVLLAAPGRPFAYAGYVDTELVGTRIELRALAASPFDPLRFARGNFIDLNTICHHRDLYDWLGGFDDALPRLQDWDLILRYVSVFPPVLVPLSLAFYRRNVAWGQVTTEVFQQDIHAVVRRKTEARLSQGHVRLDIGWPDDPRLTVILGPGAQALFLAELLIHPVARAAEVTLAHAGTGPAARLVHPDDPVADLPLGPEAFASPEALAAALRPFLARESAVLALGLPEAVTEALSRGLDRPVDTLRVGGEGLGFAGAGTTLPFPLGSLPLPAPPEASPAPPEASPVSGGRPVVLLLPGPDGPASDLPAEAAVDGLAAPADLLSGPWHRLGPDGAAAWPERGPAAIARALAEAGAVASLVPAEDLGPAGLCVLVEAMRRGQTLLLPPSPFADPLIAAEAALGLPQDAAPLAAAGRLLAAPPAGLGANAARAHALAFHAELIGERLRFYLYRRCFGGEP